MATRIGSAYRFDKDGKLVKVNKARDASHAIRQKKSKRRKPISRAKALSWKP